MINKVLQSYGSLTIIRVLSRVFQFILKTYLIRNLLDKEILGHMVHLDLIVTVSLHIVKSCLKPAYQKVADPEKLQHNISSGMNLMNIGIIVTSFFSFFLCAFQLYHYQNMDVQKRLLYLNYCIVCYGVAAISEAFFQKYNVTNVLKYNYKKSAFIQMSAFLPKTLFIFIAAQTGMFQQYGILVFGIGHLIYTILLFVISFFSNSSQNRTIFACKIDIQNNQDCKTDSQDCKNQQKPKDAYYYVDQKTKESAKDFLSLSLLKLGIQQFQKIALVALDVSSFSSVYTLISNLGSIVVRYVFAPLQEIVYNYFSRGDQKQSVSTLILLVKSITLFSCLSLTFGYNYSEAFLGLLYGEKWVDVDSIRALQIYTILLSVLGINGIMDAFLFAKGVNSLKMYKYISIIPTVIYVLLSFYLLNHTNWGTSSFFLANTLTMMIRIVISWNLQIKKHISLEKFFLQIKPSTIFLLSILLTFVLGNQSLLYIGLNKFNSYLKDMAVGGFLFSINLSVICFQNRSLLKQRLTRFLNPKTKKQ